MTSIAAAPVLGAFAEVMVMLSTTDPTQWEPAEVIAFADGIEHIHKVMQYAKQQIATEQNAVAAQGQEQITNG